MTNELKKTAFGIHTVDLLIDSRYDKRDINSLDMVLNTKTKVNEDSTTNYVLELKKGRLDMELVDGKRRNEAGVIKKGDGYYKIYTEPYKEPKDLLSLSEAIDNLTRFIEILELEGLAKVPRVEVAFDLPGTLNKDWKRLSLVVELFNLHFKGRGVYETIIDLVRRGNVKSKSTNLAITSYDCTDKSRLGNTRVEFKVLKTKCNGNIKETLTGVYKEYLAYMSKINKNLKESIEKIEEKHAKIILEYMQANIKDGNYTNFSAFIQSLETYKKIITKGVLEKLYKESGLGGDFKNWLNGYRNAKVYNDKKEYEGKRKINFSTEAEAKTFFRAIKKELKLQIENEKMT